MSPLLTIESTVPIHYFADIQAASDAVDADTPDGVYTVIHAPTDNSFSGTWCPNLACVNCPLKPIKHTLNTSHCPTAAHHILLTTYPNITSTNPEWFL
jgi:hypothetical protein